jgi:hypothetical protein
MFFKTASSFSSTVADMAKEFHRRALALASAVHNLRMAFPISLWLFYSAKM